MKKILHLKNSILNLIWKKLRFFLMQGEFINNSDSLFSMCRIKVYKGAKLYMGKDTKIAPYTSLGCRKSVYIGDHTMISQCCHISDFQHNYKYDGYGRNYNTIQKNLVIKKNVWIGFGSTVISSEIGENSVIGCNGVVINMRIPKNTIFIGDCRLNYKMKELKLNDKNMEGGLY